MANEPWQTAPPDQKQFVYVPQFFVPSVLKFAVMSIFTIGIYPLYWFYENWIVIKLRTKESLSPSWRATLAPFWAYNFFNKVQLAAEAVGLCENLYIAPMVSAFVLTQLLWLISEWGMLIYLFSFIPLLHVNHVLGKINQQLNPNAKPNSRFTIWNCIMILIVIALGATTYVLMQRLDELLQGQGTTLDLLMKPNPMLF